MPQDRYRPQPYEQCAKVLAKMGYEEDAKQIQIAKHKKRLKFMRDALPAKPWKRGWLTTHIKYVFSWLYGKVSDFGYSPFRAASFLLVFWLFGAGLFLIGGHYNFMSSTQTTYLSEVTGDVLAGTSKWEQMIGEDNYLQLMTSDYPHFNAAIYSLDTLIPLIDLHQEPYWMPNVNRWFGHFLWWYQWLHILAGWVLTTLLIAGLTGIMRNHDRG